jgi:hypothetical protein
MGDRRTEHNGAIARKFSSGIGILFDAELKDLPICQQAILFCCACFSIYDKKRSYLYLRENSLETNIACAPCCGLCETFDNVSVKYFDRAPYAKNCKLGPFPCCFLFSCDQPKLEVVDMGCMCCFVKMDPCCCGKSVVMMPFEKMPIPWCCCSNRVGCCDNCGGLCGPVTGNPKIFSAFIPQPKDAQGFVNAAQGVMLNFNPVTGGLPTQNPIAVAQPMNAEMPKY